MMTWLLKSNGREDETLTIEINNNKCCNVGYPISLHQYTFDVQAPNNNISYYFLNICLKDIVKKRKMERFCKPCPFSGKFLYPLIKAQL